MKRLPWNFLHVLSKAENILPLGNTATDNLNKEDLKMMGGGGGILIWNVAYSTAYLERTSDIKLEEKCCGVLADKNKHKKLHYTNKDKE